MPVSKASNPTVLLRCAAGLALALSAASCSDPPADASFGEPQKLKDDGSVRKIEAPPAPPRFDDALAVVPSYDKATGMLVVTLKIKPGFHAYGPGEETGKPVNLSVDAPWAVDGAVQIPAGQKKDLGQLGTSVILEGDVPLSAMVKGGSGELKGTVNVQICTDTACDRPRPHAFAVPSA